MTVREGCIRLVHLTVPDLEFSMPMFGGRRTSILLLQYYAFGTTLLQRIRNYNNVQFINNKNNNKPVWLLFPLLQSLL